MKSVVLVGLLMGLIATGSPAQAGEESANTPLQSVLYFGICSENIERIDIVDEGKQGLPIMVIALTQKGKAELHELTREHLGWQLDVVFDGLSFGRNRIHASVSSGLVFSREWRSKAAALAFADLIRNDQNGAPCGLLRDLEDAEGPSR